MPEKEGFIPDNELGEPLAEQEESSNETAPRDELIKAKKEETSEEKNENNRKSFEILESRARERRDARSKKLDEWAEELDSTFPLLGLKDLLAKNPLTKEELYDRKIPKHVLPLIEKYFNKKNEIGDEMNNELNRIEQERIKHMEESVDEI